MSIFNSLGSNYDFRYVVKSLTLNSEGSSDKLRRYLEKKYQGDCTLVYKGREAIKLALEVANLPKESIVAINGFTCWAVYKAVIDIGLKVEYLDVEKGTLNFGVEEFTKAIKKNPNIKAVIVQNTLGYPCDIVEIKKICQERKIVLIEDLAHSIGTLYKNKKEAGLVGDFVTLSFSQDKVIDGVSGGALVVRNWDYRKNKSKINSKVSFYSQFKDRFYPLSTFLIRKFYDIGLGKALHKFLKEVNFLSAPFGNDEKINPHSLPDWYSELVYSELINIDTQLKHRKKITQIYEQNLNLSVLYPNIVHNIENSTNLRFPIFTHKREKIIKSLKENGVYISDIWYDAPISPKKYLSKTTYKNECPNSEEASNLILNLPTHINISERDAFYISKKVNECLN